MKDRCGGRGHCGTIANGTTNKLRIYITPLALLVANIGIRLSKLERKERQTDSSTVIILCLPLRLLQKYYSLYMHGRVSAGVFMWQIIYIGAGTGRWTGWRIGVERQRDRN